MPSSIHSFTSLPEQAAPLKGGPAKARGQGGQQTGAPVIGVIYNPRSHRNKGRDLDMAVQPNIFVAQPEGRDAIPAALERLAQRGLDLLVIHGGDGTVRDVLTHGYPIFGDDWPVVAVLPKGKTNALTVDLGARKGWGLPEAVAALDTGRRIMRRPVLVRALDSDASPLLGFIFGAGAYTLGVHAGQDAHKLGAFNSLAVGAASVWGVLQALFGSDRNPWRRGVPMEIRLGKQGEPMAHSGYGEAGRREVLLASTLERFPLGLKIFGELNAGLKLSVMDKPRRRLLVMLPAILAGWWPKRLPKMGMHHIAPDQFEIDLGDQFILDGEAFPPGRYRVEQGPDIAFLVP